MTHRHRRALLVLLATLALPGCESLGVALGVRTRLDKLPVTTIAAALLPPGGIAPGAKAQLVVSAATADGKSLTTVGAGNGTVLFDSFTFGATVVQVQDGVVSMPADPRLSDAQPPHLEIAVVGHPQVRADLDVPPRYDVAFQAHFSGAAGRSGFDGARGSDGSDGLPGSIDPNAPAPGGNGGDGARGADGDDGGPGQDGPPMQVAMTLRAGSPPLLEVRVSAGARVQYYLVDPGGGSLAIDANGGAGGAAGQGGAGGRGGTGGTGSPSGRSGSDGLRGFDGRPGAPGRAGTISVSVDEAAQPYLNVLRLSNHDGSGRPGAAPQISVAPLAALW
jgi:hypothetical protein